MSDKDILFIKEASSKLSRKQSDASFERNLIDAYNLSARRSGMPEITKLSDISGETKQKVYQGDQGTNTSSSPLSKEQIKSKATELFKAYKNR